MSGKLQSTVNQYRQQLLQQEQHATQQLEHAYAATLSAIQPRLDVLYKQMQAYIDKGEKVPPEFLYEQHRLQVLTQYISGEVNHYGALAQTTTQALQQTGVQLGQASAMQMLHESVPHGVNWSFGVPSERAIADLVGATQKGSPLYDLFHGFGDEAAENVSKALITGLSLGDNPRVVANNVAQALQIPRYRALVLARDQMVKAYRSAALETYKANDDVCDGWIWMCSLSPRSCAACVAMHGSEHSLDEDLDDHVCGRCARVPKTKSWSDILGPLGIDSSDISDTTVQIQSGSDWFDNQSEATQRSILGSKAAYDLYSSGDYSLMDFVSFDSDEDWGDSISVKPASKVKS